MSSTKPHPDPLTDKLKAVIRCAVKSLAVMKTFVIVMGVLDVVWTLYQRMSQTPFMLLQISDILATFGAFMAVLIAIEIIVNITIYLREDVIHVTIVMATALMAIARKVIILDIEQTEAAYLYGLAMLVFAMSVGYWLVVVCPWQAKGESEDKRNRSDEHPEGLVWKQRST